VLAAPVVQEAGKAHKKKQRNKKDKNAPKKPMSPFFCYQAVRRAPLKVEQPTLKNTDIIRVSKHDYNLSKLFTPHSELSRATSQSFLGDAGLTSHPSIQHMCINHRDFIVE